MRGRRPTPTALLPQRSAAPSGPPPEAPAHIAAEALALEGWRQAAASFHVGPSDQTILELYAVTYAAWRSALAQIAVTGGPVIAGAAGPEDNPFLRQATARKKELLQLIEHLGLSPRSRVRLQSDGEGLSPAANGMEIWLSEYDSRPPAGLPAPVQPEPH